MDTEFLYDQVSLILELLQQELVRESKNLTMVVHNRNSTPIRRVPLDCAYEVEGVPFAPIVKALYQRDLDEEKVLEAWDGAVKAMIENHQNLEAEVAKRLRDGLPRFDFTRGQHSYYPCIQFLKGLSFNEGYSLKSTKTTCLVETPSGKKIGIDRQALYDSVKGYRTRRRIEDLRNPLSLWRGRTLIRPASPRTYGAYHHLQKNLSHHADVIDALFSIAVEAGPEVEEATHRKLDSYFEASHSEPKAVFKGDPIEEARGFINTSVGNPIKTLASLLTPVIGSKKFVELFGNPYQPCGSKYTPKTKQKYLRGIEKIAISVVREAEVKKEVATYDLLSTMFGI